MKKVSALAFLLLFIAGVAFAQNGSLKGTIVDKISKETIIGANVKVDGTTLGAVTDINGQFEIRDVSAGLVNLTISYVSYKTVQLTDVEILAGKVTVINFDLEEDLGELGEVVVVAARETNTDIAIIADIRRSFQVVSGMSAEQISLSLDRDAAQVIKRVPGITVTDNNFVQIRGLASRYNPVQLHNAFAPSVEADIKSFNFNILPSSQLDRMLVFKSPSPDISGEFSGGLVKIFTKSIPEENIVTLDYSTQFRSNTTFQLFRNQERSENHWTGFNDGTLDLPSSFPKSLRSSQLPREKLLEAGKSLPNVWEPEERTAGLDQRVSLTSAFKFNLGDRVKVGNITSLNYSNSYTNFGVARSDFNQTDPLTGNRSIIFDYNDQQYSQSIRTGLLHNWAFKVGNNHLFEIKNLFNQNSVSQYVDRYGKNLEAQQFADLAFGSYDQVYRGIYSGQVLGNHNFLSETLKLDWMVGYNASNRDQPDYKRYRKDIDLSTDIAQLYIPPGQAVSDFLGRFYSEMDEDAITASLGISKIVKFKGLPDFAPEFKAGLFYEKKERTFQARNIGYVRPVIGFNNDLQFLDIWELFDPKNINFDGGIRIDEQSNPSDSYSASNELMAGFGMVNIPVTKNFSAVVGVRYEDNTQILNSATFTNQPINVNYPVKRFLPSANFSLNISEKSLLRLAYGETLNRPEFRELAPFGFYDFNTNFTNRGNPFLKTPKIHNSDFRFEMYPTPFETVSLAIFYKYFIDPIETVFIPGAGSQGAKAFTFGNAESATSYGAELEVKKSFMGMTSSSFLDKINVVFNAALIRSEVNLGAIAVGQSSNRPLQGQAPYVVNSTISYSEESSGLQINALYNVVGKNIIFVGFDAYPDIYIMPRNVLDVTIVKRVSDKFKVKVGVSDLLNQENTLLQDGNDDNVLDRKKDNIIQEFKPGSVYSVGISYDLFRK
jgi:outer membrane receptor for ferrienterochelin and colicin